MTKRSIKHSLIRDINIIDMILIDHRHIKDCVDVLIDEKSNKTKKLEIANGFLSELYKHSEAEERIVYTPLRADEEFHFNILEAEVEHGIFYEKIKTLKTKISRCKELSDEKEAELKVLAELVKNHIKEEESELLPRMNEFLEEEALKTMGQDYMKLRKMTSADLENHPHLPDELIFWKDEVQKISSQFLTKVDKYVDNLKH